MDIILREYVMKIRLISLSKKFSKSILLTLCFFMLFSCATTVNVRLTRPAQLDLNGARTIAVLPFKPGQYYVEYDTSLGKTILINTFYQIFEIKDQQNDGIDVKQQGDITNEEDDWFDLTDLNDDNNINLPFCLCHP